MSSSYYDIKPYNLIKNTGVTIPKSKSGDKAVFVNNMGPGDYNLNNKINGNTGKTIA